jgi:hypothetical protein
MKAPKRDIRLACNSPAAKTEEVFSQKRKMGFHFLPRIFLPEF